MGAPGTRHHFVLLLYLTNFALIIVLLACYLKKIRGVWPPGSRKAFILGWAWYIMLYALALQLYSVEARRIAGSPIMAALGIGMISAGSILSVWAFMTFRSARRILGAQLDVLITRGPYRYVRNPQYLAVIFILLCLAILHYSAVVLGFALLQAATFYLLALLEERELEERFASFKEYKRKVPRFLPKIALLR